MAKKTVKKSSKKSTVSKSSGGKKAASGVKAKASKSNQKPQSKKTAPKKATKSLKKAMSKKTQATKGATKKSPAKKPAPGPGRMASKSLNSKGAVTKKSSHSSAKPKTLNKTSPTKSAPKTGKEKSLDLSKMVTPLDDRIVVQLSTFAKMTPGGLYIPDTVSDVSGNLQGTVVAVGRGHVSKKGHLRKMDVQVGDKIVFSEYTGSKINMHNEDLIILREAEVLGVISK